MDAVYRKIESQGYRDYSFFAFGKKWKSIAACCEYYGIKYTSVMQYKSDYKCDTETALQHYIDYKNKCFYFRKKKWHSIKECCEFYNINYKAFLACKSNWNLSVEESLEKYINMDKNSRFIFRGVTYDSFVDCCKAWHVNPVMVDRYRRKKKLMRRRGLIEYIKYKEKKMEKTAFCFENETYKTFTECCNCYGIKAPLVRAYAKRHSVSLDLALTHYLSKLTFELE